MAEQLFENVTPPEKLHVCRCPQAIHEVVEVPVNFFVVCSVVIRLASDNSMPEEAQQRIDIPSGRCGEELVDCAE